MENVLNSRLLLVVRVLSSFWPFPCFLLCSLFLIKSSCFLHLCHEIIWIFLGWSCLLLRSCLILLLRGFLSFSWNFNSLNSLDLLFCGSISLICLLHGCPWVVFLNLLGLFRGWFLAFLSAGNRPDDLIFSFSSCCGIYLSNDLLIG